MTRDEAERRVEAAREAYRAAAVLAAARRMTARAAVVAEASTRDAFRAAERELLEAEDDLDALGEVKP
jgi:hypothetical protein